jgi:hypothetical protein
LDKESILPGQNWEKEIRKAIKSSNYFVPLFSSNSIKKRGHVQKEFKFSLEILEEVPESDIYVIPVRLDDSEIPLEKLKKYQYVDLFPDWKGGFKRKIQSLAIGEFTEHSIIRSKASSRKEVKRISKITKAQVPLEEQKKAARRETKETANQYLRGTKNFVGEHLPNGRFFDTNLEGADFSDAYLKGADFEYSNLKGARFLRANLQNADFWEADLQDANLSNADLRRANFNYANLKGADLTNARRTGADFDDAIFT